MPRIYISYRRSDNAAVAGRIADRLSQVLGRANVSTDFDDPPAGTRFVTHVENALRTVDVVLVIVGERWGTSTNHYGFSELFDTGDFIRLEIEAVLRLNKIVIPVLVNTAALPVSANLPATLAPLLDKQAVRVRNGADFEADINALIAQLDPQSAKPMPSLAANNNHIFLSYSRKDTPVMQRLRDDLRVAGLEVWADDNLEPGTSAWEKTISAAIRSAGCLVVILSPDAEQSTWVGRELAMAETFDKRIFPILARGSERDAIPFRLMSHQWVDARHNYTEAFDKLLTAVNKYLSL
jgi:hypothetical protein